ncbi:MAG: hypothetical protein LBH76_05745 [Propionibacteriaceae bacterium]|jgi:hypothetical protein|nr:hypothetical protein [Propionibacteriaceae bacterium]
MPSPSLDKVQLSVRVDEQVARRLDAKVAQARQAGRRVTKERLVSDAIMAAYPDNAGDSWLPVHQAAFAVDVDPRSTTALLDLLDDLEAAER